jgi:hypothetical protein
VIVVALLAGLLATVVLAPPSHAAAPTDVALPSLPTTPTLPPVTAPTMPTPPTVPSLGRTPSLSIGDVSGAARGIEGTGTGVGGAVTTSARTLAPPRAAPRPSSLHTGHVRDVGLAEVLRLARDSTPMLVLALVAVLFLAAQSVRGRRDPRFVSAPVDRREAELEFE